MSGTDISRYWIGTVSKEHVMIGVKEGICQVCHGRKGPLSRMKKNDWLIYYSPKTSMENREMCQKFTAIGRIMDDQIYEFRMSSDFVPFRRHVEYVKNIREQSILPLLDTLSFTKNKGNKWGVCFRYGLFEISRQDFELIYQKMILPYHQESEHKDDQTIKEDVETRSSKKTKRETS
jgi:hypothetical protein